MKTHDLIIIGAGPAGLSAAAQALDLGIIPLVIDENADVGGRIYAQSGLMKNKFNSKTRRKIQQLFGVNAPSEIVRKKKQVIGIFPDNILLVTEKDGTARIKYKSLIIATGARELSIPFPGWTLPGVMTSGCAQTTIKTQAIFPEQAVVAGTGPLQLVLADQILKMGGKVLAVVETGSMKSWLKASTSLFGHWGVAGQLTACLINLAVNRVPIHFDSVVSAARGEDALREIEISSMDGKRKRTMVTDALCIGYGFVSSHELSLAAGARQVFKNGQWVPVRDEVMQTSVPGVFAAGDSAGINGAVMAEYEGALSAVGAAKYLNVISDQAAEKRQRPLYDRIRKEKKLREQFDRIMKLPDRVYELADDDTIICRCEDLSLGELKRVVKRSGPDINEFKRLTRAGMGLCQGRTCSASLRHILSRSTGTAPDKIGMLTPRPPFKPITLGQLSKDFTDQIIE